MLPVSVGHLPGTGAGEWVLGQGGQGRGAAWQPRDGVHTRACICPADAFGGASGARCLWRCLLVLRVF